MKIFKFRYEKDAMKNSARRMEEALKTGRPQVREDEMTCDSYQTMNKLMSTARLDVFVAIVEQRPESLYELAQILKKDQSQVLKDSRTLEGIGLIKLVAIKDGNREKLRPEPLYDKIIFEVEPRKTARSA